MGVDIRGRNNMGKVLAGKGAICAALFFISSCSDGPQTRSHKALITITEPARAVPNFATVNAAPTAAQQSITRGSNSGGAKTTFAFDPKDPNYKPDPRPI